ncbi:MAG: hypothetical protein AB1397_00765 [bacterium]
MEVFGIAVAILTGILTYQTWKNGRWMKQAHEDTQALIKEMHNDTRETLKEIAHLIVAEGERTRGAIKEAK